MIKALVFDLDGTLVDTVPLIVAAQNQVFAHYGLPELSAHEMCSTIRHPFSDWLLSRGIRQEHLEMARMKYAGYDAYMRVRTNYFAPLMPHAREILECAKQNKLPCYIVSASRQGYIDKLIDAHNIRPYFSKIYARVFDKTETLIGITRALRAKPQEVWYMGDWHADMLHGIEAECFTVGLAHPGYTHPDTLHQAGAHMVVESHAQLACLLR